jgi:hypothetical protein
MRLDCQITALSHIVFFFKTVLHMFYIKRKENPVFVIGDAHPEQLNYDTNTPSHLRAATDQ